MTSFLSWDDILYKETAFHFIFAGMIRSAYLYGNHFVKMALNGNLRYACIDFKKYRSGQMVFGRVPAAGPAEREEALKRAVRWLLQAQERMADSGFGSWHAALGWSASYPETSGYIIPTLLHYSVKNRDDRCQAAAICAGDFLLRIQKSSGGWQGGRVGENRPEIVFNTGQVIRGMLALYECIREPKYLEAAVRAADWLCRVQHPEGYWKEHALMNEHRVYDAYVDAPLLALYKTTGDETYRTAALRNLQWITGKKMQPNGWFEDCDNTVRHNDRPILHTIAYTLDGLLESDDILGDGSCLQAATTGADALRETFLRDGRFYGRYDRHWRGSEDMICTGAAQMAIVWMRLHRLSGNGTYLDASDRALNLLLFILNRAKNERMESLGALPGSFPVWGRYEPFAFPNWATKFFCDALLMRAEFIDRS